MKHLLKIFVLVTFLTLSALEARGGGGRAGEHQGALSHGNLNNESHHNPNTRAFERGVEAGALEGGGGGYVEDPQEEYPVPVPQTPY